MDLKEGKITWINQKFETIQLKEHEENLILLLRANSSNTQEQTNEFSDFLLDLYNNRPSFVDSNASTKLGKSFPTDKLLVKIKRTAGTLNEGSLLALYDLIGQLYLLYRKVLNKS